jgi:hypothetical protein
MGPNEAETKIDCVGEDQQQFTQSNTTWHARTHTQARSKVIL